MGAKPLDGEKMLDYFKHKYGISISESIFKCLRTSLQEVLDEYDYNSAHISQRSTLKSLLHIYIAHIGCLRPLKLSIRQIMSSSEMQEQKKLIDRLE
jgi:hypothetical protein